MEVDPKILRRGVGSSCRWNCFMSTELEHIFEKICGIFFITLSFFNTYDKIQTITKQQNLKKKLSSIGGIGIALIS